jgi:hypothetical protein
MRIIFIAIFFTVIAFSTSHAQTTNYQVYALFVVNIAKYSAWPNTNGELRIGVFGKSKVFEELMKHNGKAVNGNTIKVFQVETVNNMGDAHMLYVSDGKSSDLDELLKVTHGQSVMIITEREGLFKKGAGFSFFVTDNKSLRFDMNQSELDKRSIKVSKNLSALANSSI